MVVNICKSQSPKYCIILTSWTSGTGWREVWSWVGSCWAEPSPRYRWLWPRHSSYIQTSTGPELHGSAVERNGTLVTRHDDVIKWKLFPCYWPFVRGIHRYSPHKRPVTRIFDVFFDLRLNKCLSKQSWGWWFEMPSHPLWRHCNVRLISLTASTCILNLMVGLYFSSWPTDC